MTTTNYTEYTVRISNEPSYYGSECTEADVGRITERLANIIRTEFPGIRVEVYTDGTGSSKTTGPDADVIEEINRWIENNWTAAL